MGEFYTFIGGFTDRRFRFFCDLTFNYLIALDIYRAGVRRNNSEFIKAGKCQLLKLFYGFGMRNYQEIMFKDLKTRFLAPPEIREFLEANESFSATGQPSKGEGGDFILESINGKITRWLPPGIPKEKHWLEVCRNADFLQEIRDMVCRESGISDFQPQLYQRDITNEVFQYRTRIRTMGYLDNTENINQCHTSVSGKTLDRDLINFEAQLNSNLEKYLSYAGIYSGQSRTTLSPIFTTPEQRHKFNSIDNKIKKEIMDMVEDGLPQIRENGEIEEANRLAKSWCSIRCKTKCEMIQFYKDMTDRIEERSSEFEESDSENEAEDCV